MTSALDTILAVLTGALFLLVGYALLRPKRISPAPSIPPTPNPIQDDEDPNPDPSAIDELDASAIATDTRITPILETADEKPALPSDFSLDRPDPRAVDLLSTLADQDSTPTDANEVHDKQGRPVDL